MKTLSCLLLAGMCAMMSANAGAAEKETPPLLQHKVKSLTGKEVELSKYDGKVLLVVNVASKCGATPQYEQLQGLHEKYKDQGLAVLGFPCNQFGKQEPGSADEIGEFCKKNYGVSFDMFQKVDVNGPEATELYKELTSTPTMEGKIKWNFEKFLIGRDGKVVARFATGVQPDAPEVIKAVEAELAKK